MMMSLSQRSLRLCQNVSPVAQVAFLRNSLPGTRYASLTSAIGHAARKSAAVETSRENRFTRRSKDNRHSPESSPRIKPLGGNRRSAAFSDRPPKSFGDSSRDNGFNRRSRDNQYSPAPASGEKTPSFGRRSATFSDRPPKSYSEPSRENRFTRRSRDNQYPPVSSDGKPFAPNRRSVAFSDRQSKGFSETSRENGFTRRSKDDQYSSVPPDRIKPLAPNRRSVAFSDRQSRGISPREPRDDLPHWHKPARSGGSGKGSGNKKRRRGKDHEPTDEVPERVKENVHVPASIPYTTSASEFIYGLSAVEAALRCTRRKLYTLYIYQSAGEELSSERIVLRKLALARGIKVKMAFADWDKLLDKISAGRPHNGCILEASPMPQLPVSRLEPISLPTDDHFDVSLSAQSVEEAAVNGSSNRVARVPRYDEAEQSRFPFVVLLDGILDPGNMGAVIRSAYYLGVDALVLTGRNSAPMSPVTIKASAGAAENMTILKVNNDMDFIRRSRQNGWRFYAADSPANIADMENSHGLLVEDNSGVAGSATNLLTSAPTVLMLGSEATGLLPRIKAQADGFISIPGARIRPDIGINDTARVDSLNVSVAAALLMEMLMRVPLRIATVPTPPTPAEQAPTESPPRSFEFN